ncbi:MAG: DUF2809 domain-containing protein [Chitinivibrionales bacterium]
MTTAASRPRALYCILAILTIPAGLFTRSPSLPLPSVIATYGGDTLWALMVFWFFCIIFPAHKTSRIAVYTLLFSFLIEFSQFYHAPWIDSLRNTRLGGLILGYGFKLSDLICYTVGIVLGAVADKMIVYHSHS